MIIKVMLQTEQMSYLGAIWDTVLVGEYCRVKIGMSHKGGDEHYRESSWNHV